jgi:hypothetical protein
LRPLGGATDADVGVSAGQLRNLNSVANHCERWTTILRVMIFSAFFKFSEIVFFVGDNLETKRRIVERYKSNSAGAADTKVCRLKIMFI